MKNKPKREFITDVMPFSQFFTIYKKSKKNQENFKITKNLIKEIFRRAKKAKKKPELVITIPANMKENYIITCHMIKQRKV